MTIVRPKRQRRSFLYGLLAVVTAASLTLTTALPSQAFSWVDLLRGGIQVIQGVQLQNLSPRQEQELGSQINKELMSREFKRYNNSAIQSYVNQVGQRIIATSDPKRSYTFQVIDSDQINAFATMGGYVYVTTGLLKAADNEAELAGVLGHEVGHIKSRHALEQMSQAAFQQGAASAAGLDRNTAVQLGLELALRRPHSRRAEYEADQIGLDLMGRAGYAQSAMSSFMQKLTSQGAPPAILSTHPAPRDRVRAIERGIDPAKAQGYGLDPNAYQANLRTLR